MSLFLYLDRDTWLHRLDARTKLLGILALFAIGLLFSDPRYLIAPSMLVIMLAWATRCGANLWRFRVLLSLLFLYSLLLWPWFVRGSTPLLKIGGTMLTREALEYGLAMGLRLDFMLITGLLLISATKVEEFTLGLQRFGLPPPIGFTLSLAFRWVPTLIGTSKTIVQAQRARGLDLSSGSVIGRIRRYPPLVVPLLGHTLRQTQLLAMGLESKGIGPGSRRHHFGESRMRLPDYVALAVMLALLGLSIWLRWRGLGTVDVRF